MGVHLSHVSILNIFLSMPQALADGWRFSNRKSAQHSQEHLWSRESGVPGGGGERCWHSGCSSPKGTLCWIRTTHCTETKPFSICGRKVTNCHMSLCCAYVKWAQPIAFAHSLCDLLSHTMSALLSPVLMLCNLLCSSAAGSSPLRIRTHFAT